MIFNLTYEGMPYEFRTVRDYSAGSEFTRVPSIISDPDGTNNCYAPGHVCKNCKFNSHSTLCVDIAYRHIRATLLPTNPELFI